MLSIVTITFNNYEELMATEDSVASYKDAEKVVINGGSCKRTKEFLDQHQNILSVSEKDDGIADAFSKGVRLSTQKYVTLLNSGDKCISATYYNDAVAYLESHPEVDYVHAKIIFKDPDHGDLIQGKEHKSYKMGMFLNHPGLVARRSLYEEVGYFSKNYRIAMDYEWLLRTVKAKKRSHFMPVIAIEMDGQGISSVNEWQGFNESLKAIKESGLYDFESRVLFFIKAFKLGVKRNLPKPLVRIYKRLLFRK